MRLGTQGVGERLQCRPLALQFVQFGTVPQGQDVAEVLRAAMHRLGGDDEEPCPDHRHALAQLLTLRQSAVHRKRQAGVGQRSARRHRASEQPGRFLVAHGHAVRGVHGEDTVADAAQDGLLLREQLGEFGGFEAVGLPLETAGEQGRRPDADQQRPR